MTTVSQEVLLCAAVADSGAFSDRKVPKEKGYGYAFEKLETRAAAHRGAIRIRVRSARTRHRLSFKKVLLKGSAPGKGAPIGRRGPDDKNVDKEDPDDRGARCLEEFRRVPVLQRKLFRAPARIVQRNNKILAKKLERGLKAAGALRRAGVQAPARTESRSLTQQDHTQDQVYFNNIPVHILLTGSGRSVGASPAAVRPSGWAWGARWSWS